MHCIATITLGPMRLAYFPQIAAVVGPTAAEVWDNQFAFLIFIFLNSQPGLLMCVMNYITY